MKILKGCLTWVGGFFMFMIVLGVIANMAPKTNQTSSTTQDSHSKPKNTPPKKVPVATQTAPTKIERVPVASILKSYENNKLQADQHFKDKRIQVSGIVTAIGSDIMDQPYVTLGTGEAFEVTQVQCLFDSEQAQTLANLNKGQKLIVEGQVEGYVMNILLKDCQMK